MKDMGKFIKYLYALVWYNPKNKGEWKGHHIPWDVLYILHAFQLEVKLSMLSQEMFGSSRWAI